MAQTTTGVIDAAALMAFEIPSVTQRLTERDAILYALSVGFGSDPMDLDQLAFVDAAQGLKVAPSLALVLAHPGSWTSDPRTGVDYTQVVHGEQRLTLHAALPSSAQITGQTRVTGVIDKGPGRGALIYSTKELRDERGTLLATADATIFARGNGGFGGPSGPVQPVPPAPTGTPDHIVDLPTRPEQALYYRLNGDENPLHSDPAMAARAGFPRPILHGLCTMGVVMHALLRARCGYDPARLRSVALRFAAPVFPGETIRTEMWNDGGFRARVLERDSVVVNNGLAVLA